MILPIYDSASHDNIPPVQQGNKGLRFERFFDRYTISTGQASIGDGAKRDFLNNFSSPCGDWQQLTQFALHQLALIQSLGGESQGYELSGHLVTGMGNAHPVENGFLWHPTLGVPYLSGSQVKGLLRSLLEQYYTETDKSELLLQWFGSDHKDPEQREYQAGTGELIFFDAVPTEPPELTVDIMTPHMGKWYLDGGTIQNMNTDSDKIPADWHDPNPIPFLAVKQARFLFTIARRHGSSVDIREVFACLDHALQHLGAGAKTQVGYGYMLIDKKWKNYLDRATERIGLEKRIAIANGEERIRLHEELKKLINFEWLRYKLSLLKSSGSLTTLLSNNFNRLKEEIGEDAVIILCTILREEDATLLEEWGNSIKKNEQKAFKRVMSLTGTP